MQDIRTLIRMIKQVWGILSSKQRRKMLGVFIIILIGAILELLGVSAILPFIQAIVNPEEIYKYEIVQTFMDFVPIHSDMELILWVGVAIILIYIVKNVYMILDSYVQVSYNHKTQEELSVLMYNSYLNRPYSFFVSNDSGQIMRGINADISSVCTVIEHIFKITTQILTIIAITIYLFVIDYIMALMVVLLGIICFLLIMVAIKKKIAKAGLVSREASARTSAWTIQTIAGIKDIFVFDKRKYAGKKYNELYDKQVKANITFYFLEMCPTYVIEMVCVTGIIVAILLKISTGMNAAEFIPNLSVFAMGAFKLLPAIAAATGYMSVFVYNRPAVEGAYENIVSARQHIACIKKQTEPQNNGNVEFDKEIKIDGLCWQYEGAEKDVLCNLSMVIKKGESIGIVGESGSGKSTLADLILQLYRPKKGNIYMDGMDINSIPDAWNKCLGYVAQSVFLLNDTIRANVAFGTEVENDSEVWEALERASLKKYVEGLPEQLDTVVGERGVKFSGGQRQRVAIARALYRKPQILILDEATSALDNETEAAVMEAIEKLQGTVTLIIIAHRLSTIQNCTRIYEIKDGQAIEKTP